MLSEERITALRQHVADVIADELTRGNIDWASFDQLIEPSLRIEAQIQDRSVNAQHQPLPGFTISVCAPYRRRFLGEGWIDG
jgi:hypothetical protein